MPHPFRILLTGPFDRGQSAVRVVPSTRVVRPDVDAAIETAWRAMLARPNVKLFDGPVCRFEAVAVRDGRLTLDVSRTSYRITVGTNFTNPHFADAYGGDVMANSMGVSTGLLTADGHWMMGRRNRTVAYHPGRVHPFAGSIEVAEPIDLIDNAERELREELGLHQTEIAGTRVVGIVEDLALRHPEVICAARTTRTRAAVAAGLDAAEHDGVWSIPSTPDAVAAALADEELTPVAKAVLLLGGRGEFGEAWSGPLARVLTGEG